MKLENVHIGRHIFWSAKARNLLDHFHGFTNYFRDVQGPAAFLMVINSSAYNRRKGKPLQPLKNYKRVQWNDCCGLERRIEMLVYQLHHLGCTLVGVVTFRSSRKITLNVVSDGAEEL